HTLPQTDRLRQCQEHRQRLGRIIFEALVGPINSRDLHTVFDQCDRPLAKAAGEIELELNPVVRSESTASDGITTGEKRDQPVYPLDEVPDFSGDVAASDAPTGDGSDVMTGQQTIDPGDQFAVLVDERMREKNRLHRRLPRGPKGS